MDQAQMSEVKGTCYCNLSWGSTNYGGTISQESCGQQWVARPAPSVQALTCVHCTNNTSSAQSWTQPVLPGCEWGQPWAGVTHSCSSALPAEQQLHPCNRSNPPKGSIGQGKGPSNKIKGIL